MDLIFRPLIPPAAFRSLTASSKPWWVEMPNVASLPVIEPYSPTRTSPVDESPPPPELPLPAGLLQALMPTAHKQTISAKRMCLIESPGGGGPSFVQLDIHAFLRPLFHQQLQVSD